MHLGIKFYYFDICEPELRVLNLQNQLIKYLK